MKRIISILVLLMAIVAVRAQDSLYAGINFVPEGTTLAAAVAQAKAEGKKVFLDCYTSWCGPCKKMAREVFPQDSVGTFMNPQFVSIQIDMERGEGPALAERYQVSAYPTFIIFNGDGGEIGRFVGGASAGDFISKVSAAAIDDGSSALDARWEAGERSEAFLLEYIASLGNAYKNKRANEVAQALLDSRATSFITDSTLVAIFVRYLTNPFSLAFISVAKNYAATGNAGKDAVAPLHIGDNVNAKLQNVWRNYVREVLITEGERTFVDSTKLKAWVALMDECDVTNRKALRLDLLIKADEKTKAWQSYITHIEEYWNDSELDITDLELARWSTPIVKDCNDEDVRARLSVLLRTRLEDLQSGRRPPQTRQGNMMLSGDMTRAFTMLLEKLGQ